MLGIESPGIYLAYLGSILSAVLCVVYGIINWNKGVSDDNEKDNPKQN